MVLPGISTNIRPSLYISAEREREAFYRLKRVKSILEKKEKVNVSQSRAKKRSCFLREYAK